MLWLCTVCWGGVLCVMAVNSEILDPPLYYAYCRNVYEDENYCNTNSQSQHNY